MSTECAPVLPIKSAINLNKNEIIDFIMLICDEFKGKRDVIQNVFGSISRILQYNLSSCNFNYITEDRTAFADF